MSVYSIEIKDPKKKLEYYEEVFPKLNDYYEKGLKKEQYIQQLKSEAENVIETWDGFKENKHLRDYYKGQLDILNKIMEVEDKCQK